MYDEPLLVEIGQQDLEMLDYEVVACHGSLEALERFQAENGGIDLVVSDVTMPKMPGDQPAARLLRMQKDLPVILCTGFSEKFSEAEAAEPGSRGF